MSAQLDLSQTDVDDLIKKAEHIAFDRRWHPALVRRQQS